MSTVDRHARKRKNGYPNDITNVFTGFMDFYIFGKCSRGSIYSWGIVLDPGSICSCSRDDEMEKVRVIAE